jgi:plastocyanin
MNKILLVSSMLLVLIVAGCTQEEINQSTSSKTYQISIINSSFSPHTIKISKGDTITWTNLDNTTQSITPDVNYDLKDNILTQGQSLKYTLYRSGTYRYHSEYNKNMTGTIIVE